VHVLVIDDDPTFGKLLSMFLTDQGYEVSVAEDGIQGQRVARQQLPDVIIIDYLLPAGSGQVVAERIHNLIDTQHIPMILITGKAVNEVPADIFNAGVSEVLSKMTLTKENLLTAIEKAVASNTAADHQIEALLFPTE